MQKFRASIRDGALKFGEYVEYLTRVSSEYLTGSVLPSLTSSDGGAELHAMGHGIYIDSFALYIAHTMSSVPLDR